MKNAIKTYMILIALGAGITACNSGGSNGTSSDTTTASTTADSVTIPFETQTRTPTSAYIVATDSGTDANITLVNSTATSTAANNNSCFAIVTQSGANYSITKNSSQYYSTVAVNISLKNTCTTPATISGLNLNVNGFTINGSAATINYIAQTGNPYLTLTQKQTGSNLVLSLSGPACTGNYCSWAQVPAGAAYTFTVNAQIGTAISSAAVASVALDSGTPVTPTTGNLNLTVNTASLASSVCTINANCAIGINLLDPNGKIIQSMTVNPAKNPNITFPYLGLFTGNYTIAVNTSTYPSGSAGSISYVTNPSNSPIQINSATTTNASITFNYTAPVATGNLTIKTGTISEAATFANIGLLAGVATNQSTGVKTVFNLGLNSSVTLSGLASGVYSVALQGIGDAANNIYYNSTPVTVTVPSGNNTVTSNITFAKVTTATHKVAFTVSNAPTGQSVTFANTASFKYNTNSLISGSYTFLNSEATIAVTINPLSNYTVSYNPVVITPTVNTLNVTFTLPVVVVSSGLTTRNDAIVDKNGNIIKLKGINWFGFNNGQIVNGLWNYDGLSGDFQTTVLRFKALGFNAVRLPFSFADIMNQPASNVVHNVAPATTAQLIANLTDPNYSITGKTFPALSYRLTETNSNSSIPTTTAMADFIWMIDFFAKNGFYVLIDNHTEDNSITQNSALWTQNWQTLATNIVNGMPTSSSNMVMYDIRNEPDAIGYNWTQMGTIYLNTMDAINTVTKGNNLFFIEGSGQGGINANWGDGFATDLTKIATSGLSNPNPFFISLASKSYLNQVVLSPHVYPSSVTGVGNLPYSYGSALYSRLSTSFGTLAKTGYCGTPATPVACHRFPIAVGEFGSFFTQTTDLKFMQDFASYLNNNNGAIDNNHNAIDNWFYWSYNPNSGDTGGIVDNSWTSIQWQKIEFLGYGTLSGLTNNNPNGIGLNPWFK